MPSQFFGLTIASSGLRAANAALNTTNNNISNSDTTGYSRQQVTLQAAQALQTFQTYGCAGAGVDALAIERVRDGFYDLKYWSNNCNKGEYSVKDSYMKTLQEYFADDKNTGFKTIFDKLSAALQSVVSNASSDTSKKDFISTAKSLTDYFNTMYGNIQEQQRDLNTEVKQTVDEINTIAQKIASLNTQINAIRMSGGPANELLDQRDLLVDRLSQFVDVEVTEMPIHDTNYPERETGATRYMLQIAGGQMLLDGGEFNTLECVARTSAQKVNQTDIDGLYDIKWTNGNDFGMYGASMKGSLRGLLDLRDGNGNANFQGKVTDVVTAGGVTKVEVSVSADYLKKMQECTLSDTGGVINIGSTRLYYSSWDFDETTGKYTFVMNDALNDQAVTANKIGKEVNTSEEIEYQGIPYYMNQMNSWIRSFAEKVNDIFTRGYNSKEPSTNGCIFFTGNISTGGQYTANDLDPASGNGLYELTAGNFTINEDLIKDASLLGTRTDPNPGEVEECGQIKEMIEMLTSKDKFNFRNGTAGQMLEIIYGDITINTSNAENLYDTYKSLDTTIKNQRISVSGVDKDEETVNLVKFQNSFTLASKMVQTLTEIYDQLILRTGV